ncbi:DUF1496 domain-containing protein [Oceanisphaera sp. W20_SRM_FM3]|uniref:DUF1496 domain-containing protein n=1 Tax=Oceanisphaera sp. W20_SRM_FM3 TaxID=3240267 RepID=UPI003F99E2E8
MMRLTIGLLLLASTAVAAQTINSRPALELNLNSDLEPACFYADQRYSKGSIIEMAKQPFICEREKTFEQNGRLSWQPFPLSLQAEQKLSAP